MSTIVRVARYLRVSKADQDPALQDDGTAELIAKRGWKLTETYTDHGISGMREKRPALDRLLRDARHRRMDVVIVWKADRLFRSLKAMVTTLDEWAALGVGFVSATEVFDSTTPQGKLLLHLTSAFAEFERDRSWVVRARGAAPAHEPWSLSSDRRGAALDIVSWRATSRDRADAQVVRLVPWALHAPTSARARVTVARQVVVGRTYLISRRCTQRQLLLRPDTTVEQIYLYCLGEAVQRYGITLHGFIAMSNHQHLVVRDNRPNFPEFLARLHKMIAKAMNALRGRWENFWATEQPSARRATSARNAARMWSDARRSFVRSRPMYRRRSRRDAAFDLASRASTPRVASLHLGALTAFRIERRDARKRHFDGARDVVFLLGTYRVHGFFLVAPAPARSA